MKDLIQKRSQVIDELRSLNKPEMSEDELSAYSALEAVLEKTEEAIKRAEKLAEAASRAERAKNEIVNEVPSIQVVREHNHNEHGEYRGYSPIEKGGLGEFAIDVRNASLGRKTSDKFQELRAATGMNEGVGSEGGFLVQSDHAEMLYSNAKDAGFLASKCTEIKVSSGSNSTSFNQVDETSLANGSLYGGVSAAFVGEGGSISPSKPKFRQVSVKLQKLAASAYVTEEQLEDSAQLNSFLGEAFPMVMADVLDYNILWGEGTAGPLGVFNSGALITVAKEGAQSGTIVGANINKMVDRLLEGPKASSIAWLGHLNTPAQLRSAHVAMTNSDKPIYSDPGLFPGAPAMLAGYPFKKSQQCKDLATLGDIVLGDWSQYLLFKKTGIKASQSAHVAFLTDEMVFKWTLRVNGMPMRNSAVTDKHGSTTRSGFVTLEAR